MSSNLSFVSAQVYNGTLVGGGCGYFPDIFLMSVLLFIGTFLIAVTLKDFRTSAFFPTSVRIHSAYTLPILYYIGIPRLYSMPLLSGAGHGE